MRSRLTSWLLIFVTLVALGLPGPAPAAQAERAAQAQDGLDVVKGGYDALLDLFYRPIEPRTLLRAGMSSLGDVLTARGVSAPPSLDNLPGGRQEAFAAFSKVYQSYVATLPSSINLSVVPFVFVDGMAESLNEGHTHFLTPQQYREFLNDISGGGLSVGVGIARGGSNGRIVTAVAPSGPADVAGLKVGDTIVAVDGRNVTTGSALARALAGDGGTSVTLTVDRGGPRQDIAVTRGPYYFPVLDSRLLLDNVAYLRLDRFAAPGTPMPDGTEVLSDLDKRLDAFDAQGARALILDLRDNGGGSTFTAEELLGRFLPEDVRTARNFDERGHLAYELVSGQMRAKQLPMAVLVNGSSYSASESTSSTLLEAHRAVLVGQRTGGDLATAELVPLPQGAGMEIAVAGVTSGQRNTAIDGVGVPVDVEVRDNRSAEDYRNGRDPQLDAAVKALAQAPAPPAQKTTPSGGTNAQLDTFFTGTLPDAGTLPTNDRLTKANVVENLSITHVNEWIDAGGGARDPDALQQTVRSRGYLGTLARAYGVGPGEQPTLSVSYDLYGDAKGAASSMATNDFPDMSEVSAAPTQLGDEAVASRGLWISLGSTALSWRRGRVVLSVSYSDVPGNERPDVVAKAASVTDAAYQQHPVSLVALDAAMAELGLHPLPASSQVAAQGRPRLSIHRGPDRLH